MDYWFKFGDKIDTRIIDVISKLKQHGIVCYLVTNQEKYRTEYIKTKIGMNNVFQYIFSSSEIGYTKPERKFYQFVLNSLEEKYSITVNEVLFFDDSVKNVQGAKELGIDSYLYTSFDEFVGIIERNCGGGPIY